MPNSIFEAACERAAEGMEIAAVAAIDPDRPAVYSHYGNLSFGELNAAANQIANRLRQAGLNAGDAVALVCANRPEFVVVRFACHRIGARLTTVNWHLAPDEIAYVVDNCDAMAVFCDVRVAEAAEHALVDNQKLKLSVAIGGDIAGYTSWPQAIDAQSCDDIDGPVLGSMMLYTSGTTGRPKGVLRAQLDPQQAAGMQAVLTAVFQFEPDSGNDLALTTGPLYHSGPFNLCMTTPLTAGIGTVLMDKWTPEETLQLIAKHQVSHTFFVPTMMNRLLQLDEATRNAADISSLRFIIHGAAPCSVETKQAILDWFGPILWEIFAGTEGQGTIVSPQEWLAKPGTVGKPAPDHVRVLGDDGEWLSPGNTGQLFIINPESSGFEYYKDSEKTERALRDGYFTAGDIGYIDEDGYLFLTGRSAEVIIAGGVNLYPQEIDDVLAQHAAVADVACIGVPNADFGEEVKAVVELLPGHIPSEELAKELIAFCEPQLAKQKWPRSVDFVNSMPRSAAGKVQRKALRDTYWADQARDI